MSLSAEQQLAAAHHSGHGIIFATAGSGKTTTLVEHTRQLLERGVTPESILLTTFSRDATEELRLRLGRAGITDVQVCTLHSLTTKVVMLGCTDKKWRLVGDEILEQIFNYSRRQMERHYPTFTSDWRRITYAQYQRYASIRKAMMGVEVQDSLIERLYRINEAERERRLMMGHDDSAQLAYDLLGEQPSLGPQIQHLCVDEFQDLCAAQFEFLDRFSRRCASYLAVGDDDQTLYEFRGACPQTILSFSERYNAQTYHLGDNYRCPPEILGAAKELIERNTLRAPKPIRAARAQGSGSLNFSDDPAEQVSALIRQGHAPEDIALLGRYWRDVHNAERRCHALGVPVKSSARSALHTGPLGQLLDLCSDNPQHLSRCRELLGLTEETFSTLLELRAERPLLTAARLIPLAEHQRAPLMALLRATQTLDVPADVQARALRGALIALRGPIPCEDSFTLISTQGIPALLRARHSERGIQIGTIFASKGLEWPHVVIPSWHVSRDEDPESERRILYVGMTRARRSLTLCGVNYQQISAASCPPAETRATIQYLAKAAARPESTRPEGTRELERSNRPRGSRAVPLRSG